MSDPGTRPLKPWIALGAFHSPQSSDPCGTDLQLADLGYRQSIARIVEMSVAGLRFGSDRSTAPLETKSGPYISMGCSALYHWELRTLLSLDRRGAQYAVKEAARHMSQPRECDMKAVNTLAAYLQSHLAAGRVVTRDPPGKDGDRAVLRLRLGRISREQDKHRLPCGYSLWSCGCSHNPHATRTASYQQPRCGTETFFRAAREAIYLRDLIALDFGQLCGKRADSSLVQASKRIGPGAKLRHLEVCEFYVQRAPKSKQIKVKGTFNCANFLTKHPKSGTKVKQALDWECMKLATEKTCYHRLNASPSRSPLWPSSMHGKPLRAKHHWAGSSAWEGRQSSGLLRKDESERAPAVAWSRRQIRGGQSGTVQLWRRQSFPWPQLARERYSDGSQGHATLRRVANCTRWDLGNR